MKPQKFGSLFFIISSFRCVLKLYFVVSIICLSYFFTCFLMFLFADNHSLLSDEHVPPSDSDRGRSIFIFLKGCQEVCGLCTTFRFLFGVCMSMVRLPPHKRRTYTRRCNFSRLLFLGHIGHLSAHWPPNCGVFQMHNCCFRCMKARL